MCGIPLPPPKPPVDAVTGRRLTFDQAVAHVGGLDNLLSEHGKHLIKLNAKQYLWKYPNKTTWCTACGKPIEGFYGHHGQFYACPVCGARAEFRYEAKGHGRVYDEFVLYEWRRSVLDAETVTLTATWVSRDSTHGHEPHLALLRTNTTALYVFRPGKAVTVYKKRACYGANGWDTRWERVDAVCPEHTKNGILGGADIVVDGLEFKNALEGTRIGRVFDALREASKRGGELELMAIANCARRPWLEYLAKCGQAPLAAELLREPNISREIVPNQRARTPMALLGLTAGQWGEIRRDGIQLKARTLSALRLLTRLDIGPVKVADALALDRADAGEIRRLLPKRDKWERETLGDMVRLLPDKVRRKIIRRCIREHRHIQEWIDYYSQLRELGEVSVYGPKPKANYSDHRPFAPDADPALLLPKDVHAMHQRMTERLELLRNEARIKAAEALRTKFEGAILPKLKQRYDFQAEGLVLRPYAGAAEVIAEGGALSICIGSYADIVLWFTQMRTMGFRIEAVGHDMKFAGEEYVPLMKRAGFKIKNQPQLYILKSRGFRHIEKSANDGTLYYLHSDAYEYCVANVHAIEKTDDLIQYGKDPSAPKHRIDLFDASVFACIRWMEETAKAENAWEW